MSIAGGHSVFALPPDLDRSSRVAAHLLIERWFSEALGAGNLVAGDRLPREADLADYFGVSRMTLRQSLAELESRGVLQRLRGRTGGTFITEPKIDCDLTGFAGFTEQLRRAQLRASAKVVRAQTIRAERVMCQALALAPGALVHEVVRVRSAKRAPLALEHSYFPAAIFPDLLDHRLTGSLYKLLVKSYQQEPTTAVEFLEPAILTPIQAQLLQASASDAVMLVERTASTAAGLPIEYARDLFRPDKIRISVRSGISTLR
ncbi:GntR family transcriptional regulator [Nakamurella antarctica]|uniref:GntR family transcriptional regulator n=1 Tax=Nakamurella antarctica TaxID=1902245 RepID=A0A3G8ZT55_9ACTN|nr:GntR family transcriptional regulator [Nakamurella antarctica]AZI57236.1 GntR family transcriptional regulator [Nakamurella antarctica]